MSDWTVTKLYREPTRDELATQIARLEVQAKEYHLLAVVLLTMLGGEVEITDEFIAGWPYYELIAERDSERMCTTYRLKVK